MHGACRVIVIRPLAGPLAHGGEPLGAIGGRPDPIAPVACQVLGLCEAKQGLSLLFGIRQGDLMAGDHHHFPGQ